MSLRIAQFISGRGIDGATRHATDLSRMLAERGHRVSLFCRPDSWAATQVASCKTIEFVPLLFSRRLRAIQATCVMLRERQIDVVHTHKSSANALGAILRTLFHQPTVATAHSRHWQLHWPFNSHCIAPSVATANYLRRWNRVAAKNITVIPYPFQLINSPTTAPEYSIALRKELGIASDPFLIGVIGTVVPRKGLMTLAKALPLLQQLGHQPLIVSIGQQDPAYKQEIESYLQSHSLSSSLKFLGPCDNTARLMSAFNLVCLPSRDEQLPLSILEAMASARPVLTTPVGGLRDLIHPGNNGQFAPVGSPHHWAQAIALLMKDAALCDRMGFAARQRIEQYCAPEPILTQIEQVYQTAIGQRPLPSAQHSNGK